MELAFRIFRPGRPLPDGYRSNFFHLFMDIAWFGVLSGSVIAFLSIYAVRLGANSHQIGFINAAPAVANLIFSLPSGRLFTPKTIRKNLILTLILGRIFYLIFIPLPFFFLPQQQIWLIIIITLIMSIPGSAMNIGFNTYFPEVVPEEWRGYVSGIRNAFLSITMIVTSLVSGQILTHVAFPGGYQIVFAIGFIGAALSTVHVAMIRIDPNTEPALSGTIRPPSEMDVKQGTPSSRTSTGTKLQTLRTRIAPHIDILTGPFGKVMLLMFGFHLAQYLPMPIFPIFQVDYLHLSDQTLGLGNCIFYILVFLGSMQLDYFTNRFGNRILTGIGMGLLGLYPLLLAFSHSTLGFLLTSAVGGYAWAIVGGAYFNYLIEGTPGKNKSIYMAWYSIALYAAILLGSLVGPLISGQIGVQYALILFAFLRTVSGAAILRWG